MKRDILLEYTNVYDVIGTRDTFLGAMRETVAWHCERNEFYRKLLERHGIKPDTIEKKEDDLIKLPPIHANFFKSYESLSIPREEVVVHVTSSGTTGQKSQMFFDQSSWDFGEMMIRRTCEERSDEAIVR